MLVFTSYHLVPPNSSAPRRYLLSPDIWGDLEVTAFDERRARKGSVAQPCAYERAPRYQLRPWLTQLHVACHVWAAGSSWTPTKAVPLKKTLIAEKEEQPGSGLICSPAANKRREAVDLDNISSELWIWCLIS